LGDVDRSALRTLPRSGYMLAISGNQIASAGRSFVVAVEPPDSGEPSPPSAIPHLSIVVLPFANLGGDPEQEYFADGVTDSLTTDLSRIAGAFVIGRNTAFDEVTLGCRYDKARLGAALRGIR
jgi:TolB-like protein